MKLVEPQQVQRVGADSKPVVDAGGKPVMDTVTTQTIAQGPVASQEVIKEYGTNGGGRWSARLETESERPSNQGYAKCILGQILIGVGLDGWRKRRDNAVGT